MDIQLPEMDGMTAVKELRKTNELVVVVFVTSLAQYALKGYEVGAMDFMVKPLNYYGFALKFRRAVTAAVISFARISLPLPEALERKHLRKA